MMQVGAELSLKDNMYATVKKNIQQSKIFKKQIEQVKSSVQQLAKAQANPVIRAKDESSKIIQKVRSALKTANTTVSAPVIRVRDQATRIISKVRSGIKDIGRMIANPFIRAKDGASKIISKIKSGLKSVSKMFTPFVKLKDSASKALGTIHGKLKKIGGFIAKPLIAIKDGATKALGKMQSMLKTLAKGVSIAVGIVGAGAMALLGGTLGAGAKMEQQQISIEHFIGVNNKGSGADDVKKMSESYINELRNNANSTPFTTNEVIGAGTRAINVSGGDTDSAMQLLKVAEDMAALNPEKSLSDAMEALADMKNGETERLKEFGFKISAEDIEKAGGTDQIIKNQLAPYFMGGAQKLAGSASGLVSTIKGKLGSALTDTGLAVLEKAKPFLEKMVGVVDIMAPKMKKVGETIAEGFSIGVEWISSMMDKAGGVTGIFDTISSGFGNMRAVMQPIIDAYIPYFQTGFKVIGEIVRSAMGVVSAVMPNVVSTIATVVSSVTPMMNTFKNIFASAMPIVQGIIQMFCGIVSTIMPVVSTIFQGVGEKVGSVISFIGDHMGFIKGVFDTVCPIIADVLSVAWSIISPIMDIMISVFKAVWSVIEFVFPAIQGVIETVWGILSPIFSAIADALTWVGDAVNSVIGWFGDVFSGVFNGGAEGSTKSKAVGVDRVPYDNYFINAHQGEMLLNRVEADRYQRDQGTRGIPMSRAMGTGVIARDNTLINAHQGEKVLTKQEAKGSTGGHEFTINLNGMVVKEEADIDIVVGKMVKKFNKLIPNMA